MISHCIHTPLALPFSLPLPLAPHTQLTHTLIYRYSCSPVRMLGMPQDLCAAVSTHSSYFPTHFQALTIKFDSPLETGIPSTGTSDSTVVRRMERPPRPRSVHTKRPFRPFLATQAPNFSPPSQPLPFCILRSHLHHRLMLLSKSRLGPVASEDSHSRPLMNILRTSIRSSSHLSVVNL